jgi:hypothetical protein
MNEFQTRDPGFLEPRTEIGGHNATTADAYQRWSASCTEIAEKIESTHQLNVQATKTTTDQTHADTRVVSRKELLATQMASHAIRISEETTV